MPEAIGQGKEGHLCYSVPRPRLRGQEHPTYKFPNLQEPSKDLKSVTDRAAQTLLWTELIRGLGRVLSNLLWETAPPHQISTPENDPLDPGVLGEHAPSCHLSIHPSIHRERREALHRRPALPGCLPLSPVRPHCHPPHMPPDMAGPTSPTGPPTLTFVGPSASSVASSKRPALWTTLLKAPTSSSPWRSTRNCCTTGRSGSKWDFGGGQDHGQHPGPLPLLWPPFS